MPLLVPTTGTDNTKDGQDRIRGYPEMSPFLFLLLLLRTRRGCTVLRSGKGAQGCQIDLDSTAVYFSRITLRNMYSRHSWTEVPCWLLWSEARLVFLKKRLGLKNVDWRIQSGNLAPLVRGWVGVRTWQSINVFVLNIFFKISFRLTDKHFWLLALIPDSVLSTQPHPN